MTINLQLVEVPENEQIVNRQVSLPDSGGTIGRAYDCTLQLPDFNRQLSRVHAEIVRDPRGGYQVTDRSTNGLLLNGQLLGRGRHLPVSDGDILTMGGYTLLISDMSSLFATRPESASEPEVPAGRREPVFNLDDLEADDLGWPLDDEASKPAAPDSASMFSAENVMADDRFGHDPFDDELEMKPPGSGARADVVTLDQPEQLDNSQRVIRDSLAKLTQLVEQQQRMQAEPYGHDKLMDCLQRTLDRFLEELSPGHLEEIFSDYTGGWGSKEKKYWRLYRKQFNRKLDRKEFHHRFTALFVEEMRGKG
ncbi:FHA domain-containing protein [Marinobacterium arenosum]|uniref:FHA domain-containing protein n=1 Tax=Marinobacterium arenosum TaxID=2862496 RepID=UPI001C93DCBD|nr:FHA domain-containing protein [Marinobacterium arenosum]MBY4677076.1 FHA domain-containing protein [Marinobacterium arenosum]